MIEILDALREKTDALQAQLVAKVEANLSGDVLEVRSGTLKASIIAEIGTASDTVTALVASRGVPYAAIQEYGGHTGPHGIAPVKALALAFAGGFARRVTHPGSAIPSHAYLGGALDALRGDIVGGLKGAALAALGAGLPEAA